MRVLLYLAMVFGCASHAAAQIRSVVLHAPERDFGILVGDVLVTEAVITLDPDLVLDTRSVPVAGAVDASLELRGVHLTDTVAGGARRIVIKMAYQSFFAPERVMQTELPATTISFVQGGRHVSATIPAWPYHVSPLRVAQRAADNLGDLRGDHSVPEISPWWAQLWLAASACVMLAASLVLAGGLGVLPGFTPAARPFAQAARRIARLAASEANRATAFRELHGAFDAVAGKRVLAEDLDAFLGQNPRYAALHDDINGFFAASTHVFFARPQQHDESGLSLKVLALLAKRLRRQERAW